MLAYLTDFATRARHMPVLRTLLSFSGVVHLVLGLMLMRWVWSDGSHKMTLTARKQFDNWGPLLALYQSPFVNGTDATVLLRNRTVTESWCDLTTGSVPNAPEFCSCVQEKFDAYIVRVNNASYAQNAAKVSDDAVSDMLTCMRHRPPWKVYPTTWITLDPVCLGIPILLISGVVILFAAGWAHAELYGALVIVSVVVALLVKEFTRFWLSGFNLLFFVIMVHWYIAKGMRCTPLHLRLGCAVWIAELFVAPYFGIIVCMFHSARDVLMLVAVAIIIAVSTSFGAQNYWNMHVFKILPHHMMTTQWLAWVGTLCCSAVTSVFIMMYWNSTFDRFKAGGFEFLLAITYLIALLQLPTPAFKNVGVVQMTLLTVRNVALFVIVWVGF